MAFVNSCPDCGSANIGFVLADDKQYKLVCPHCSKQEENWLLVGKKKASRIICKTCFSPEIVSVQVGMQEWQDCCKLCGFYGGIEVNEDELYKFPIISCNKIKKNIMRTICKRCNSPDIINMRVGNNEYEDWCKICESRDTIQVNEDDLQKYPLKIIEQFKQAVMRTICKNCNSSDIINVRVGINEVWEQCKNCESYGTIQVNEADLQKYPVKQIKLVSMCINCAKCGSSEICRTQVGLQEWENRCKICNYYEDLRQWK